MEFKCFRDKPGLLPFALLTFRDVTLHSRVGRGFRKSGTLDSVLDAQLQILQKLRNLVWKCSAWGKRETWTELFFVRRKYRIIFSLKGGEVLHGIPIYRHIYTYMLFFFLSHVCFLPPPLFPHLKYDKKQNYKQSNCKKNFTFRNRQNNLYIRLKSPKVEIGNQDWQIYNCD